LPTDPGHITNLITEFVFKVRKQQEDSAMIPYYLAPDTIEGNIERKNKKQKITHSSTKTKQNITDKREKTNEDQVDFRKLPTYKTLYKIIWKTVSIEIYYEKIHFT
jgi:hypothetical protein